MPLQRVCFGWHRDAARFDFLDTMPGASGLPRTRGRTIEALRATFARTRNHGYLVIGEAAMRLCDCDPLRSCSVDLPRLLEALQPAEIAEHLNRTFDALVLPMAYEITAGKRYDRVAALVEALRIPLVTLGLGILCAEDTPLGAFDESVAALLRALSRKAVLFGVRAETTKRWLDRNGIADAQALGCPSLHLYPDAIRALRGSDLRRPGPIATGGYLLRDLARSRWQCRLFAGVEATYILQDELFESDGLDPQALLVDDATGEVDAPAIAKAVEAWGGFRAPFARYTVHHALDAWRQRCAQHGAYIGDRFHGAVVALQVGRPVILFTRDVRAQELSSFYALPTADLARAADGNLQDLTHATAAGGGVEAFIETWALRHGAFEAALKAAGLRWA